MLQKPRICCEAIPSGRFHAVSSWLLERFFRVFFQSATVIRQSPNPAAATKNSHHEMVRPKCVEHAKYGHWRHFFSDNLIRGLMFLIRRILPFQTRAKPANGHSGRSRNAQRMSAPRPSRRPLRVRPRSGVSSDPTFSALVSNVKSIASADLRSTCHGNFQPLQITHGVLYPDDVVFCRSLHLQTCLPPELHLELPLIVPEDCGPDAPRRLSRTGIDG